ncbi:MAG: hypothetical protein ACLGH0_04095, partial [Thermoanaerobaculia bacterium]
DVIAPLLEPPLKQSVPNDNPNAGLPKQQHGKVFTHDLLAEGEHLNVDELWGDLERFVAERSWVSFDRQYPDMLAFHVNVETPMRRLIENEPVYRELHERAIAHYDALAREHGPRWTWIVRQAIYHRYQLGAPDAESDWRAAIAEARKVSPDAEREVAREITGREYFDGAQSVMRAGGPIVPLSHIAEAYTIEAESWARQARAQEDHGSWQKASNAASYATTYARGPEDGPLHRRIAIVRAGVLLASGDAENVEVLLQFVPVGDRETLSRELLLADIAKVRSDRKALREHLNRASTLFDEDAPIALFDREASDVERVIVEGAVEQASEDGRFDIALDVIAAAQHRAAVRGDLAVAREWAFRYGEVLREVGLPGTARYHVSLVVEIDAPAMLHIQRFIAEAHLASFEPEEALRVCDEITEPLAWIHEVRALAYAQLRRDGESRVEFERAITWWREAGKNEEALQATLRAAEVELRRLAGVAIAREFLDQLMRSSLSASRAVRWRTLMLFAEAFNEIPTGEDAVPQTLREAA